MVKQAIYRARWKAGAEPSGGRGRGLHRHASPLNLELITQAGDDRRSVRERSEDAAKVLKQSRSASLTHARPSTAKTAR